MVRLNFAQLIVGSKTLLPMKGPQISVLESRAMEVYEVNLDKVQVKLKKLAQPLCLQAGAITLPPFYAINHLIPLINEEKIYLWCPS